MKNFKQIRLTENQITEASSVEKLHAAAIAASEKAKSSPSELNHRAASDAHEKAITAHENAVDELTKKGGSAKEVTKHEQHIKMHKGAAQAHRFNAYRTRGKAMKEGSERVFEAKWKVTFAHQHPEGQKHHSYVVQAPHQNAADKKAIELHRKDHPKGNFHMWNSEELYEEGLKDACWKGYEAIGMKMKDGRKVPNCVPKEEAQSGAESEVHSEAKEFTPDPKRLEQIKKDHEDLKSRSTSDVHLMHQRIQGKVHSKYSPSDVGGKQGMISDLLRHSHGDKHVSHYFGIKEDTTTIEKPVAEASDEQKNLRITKHSKLAIEAEKRGDKQAQQYHLDKISKLKNESVNEAKKAEKPLKHLVTVTVSDPQHGDEGKRKDKIMKRVKVSGADPKEAVEKAEAHYKKHGFKVHDSLHHSVVNESLDTDEFIDSYNPEQSEGKEDDAEEVRMARAQLREIADMAQDLVDAMEDDDELEAWMQYKITSANKDLDDVYSTIAYGEDDSDEDSQDDNSEDEASTSYPTEAFEPAKPGKEIPELSDEEKAQMAKLKVLILLGLIDNSEMQVTLRAIKKLNLEQPVTSPVERKAINDLLQKLIGVVTKDPTIFRKIRMNIHK